MRSLGRLGWSLRRIEDVAEVRISRYLKAAEIEVRGRRKRGLGTNSKAPSVMTTDLERGGETTPPTKSSKCEPHRGLIQDAVAVGRNAKAIWQDLRVDHGFDSSCLIVAYCFLLGEPNT
ncbi:MAG: hypothetical protein JKY61_07270 [Planctomycetes bacterium]|nr:hypothetical protein [Planctomycetota bacterium]